MIRRYAGLAIFAAVVMGSGLGCSTSANKVEVKVTYDGQPLSDAMVSFSSEGGKGASGLTDASGMCKMSMTDAAKGKEGVESGTYNVSVVKTERPELEEKGKKDPSLAMKEIQDKYKIPKAAPVGPPVGPPKAGGASGAFKSLIPEKYNDPKKSGFTFRVPEDTAKVVEINLTSDKAEKK